MSSLSFGDSRFELEDDGSILATRLASMEADSDNFGAEDILTATSGELAYIVPEHLKDSKVIGQGTSFRVTREVYHQPSADGPSYSPYYVAVKRFISRSSPYKANSKLPYAGLLRELRVIMHPPLRSHGCFVKLIGYGWEQSPDRGLVPYLVMDYSDHGNIVEYLKRCRIPLSERRELALDVASALEALHSCGIVHGDLKADNVLIYDNEDVDAQLDDFTVRPQIARISDFGAAIFVQDMSRNSQVNYLGTPGYRAPDLAGQPGIHRARAMPDFDIFKSADVYSFGLLAWEVLKNGAKYIDVEKLRESGQNLDDFLAGLYALKCNALMESAKSFCDEFSNAAGLSVVEHFKETLSLCLSDDPFLRASMESIVSTLAKGIRATRPRYLKSRTVSQPPDSTSGSSKFKDANTLSYAVNGSFVKRIEVVSYDAPFGIRLLTDDEKPDAAARVGSLPLVRPSKASAIEYGVLDIFKVLMTRSPPWSAQCQLMQRVLATATHTEDPSKKAHAHLQLSVMYHVGYGVKPDSSLALSHLKASNSASPLHQRLYSSVSGALHVLSRLESPPSMELEAQNEESRAASRFLRPREPGLAAYTADEVLPVGEFADISELRLTDEPYAHGAAKPDILGLLTAACQTGDFNAAKEFAKRPMQLVHQPNKPSFVHWLIMFEAAEAKELLGLILDNFCVTDTLEPMDSAFHHILGQDSGPPLYFPSLCLELCGTPLHWAVRTGHIGLVSLLLDHGADINQRWRYEMHLPHDRVPVEYFRPSFTALELAVLYHFADIAILLVNRGSHTTGQDLNWNHSCLHMVGISVVPFSRFVIHGRQHRMAARQTINTLQTLGLRVDDLDSLGQTPLTLAIRGIDVEPYIIDELLQADAAINDHNSRHSRNGTMLIQCIENGAVRPLNTRCAEALIPVLEDLDALDNVSGRSALHWCASLNVVSIAQILLDTGRVDVNQRSGSGLTPLMEAAFAGSVAAIEQLVKAEADLELQDNKPGEDNEPGLTALEIAVISRHSEAAIKLIKLGAKIDAEGRSILHLAVAGASRGGSIARELLREVPILHTDRNLNRPGKDGWTALHRAAAFGDRESVEALLEAGADLAAVSTSILGGGTALDLVNSIITAAGLRSEEPGAECADISVHGRNIGPLAKQDVQRLSDIGRILSAWTSQT